MPASSGLIERYGLRYDSIRRATASGIARLWAQFGALDDLDGFAVPAAGLTMAARAEVVALVDAYLAFYLDDVTAGLGEVPIRNGADPVEVYRRPGITARGKLASGLAFADAMRAAQARAVSAGATDVALAHRAAAAEIMTQKGIAGYRRAVTGASCKLCVTASTQRYHSDRLMPIHNHCDCRIAPIVGDRDPGHVVNRATLDRLKSQGPEYWKSKGFVDADGVPVDPSKIASVTDTAVREHGELGPMLTDAEQHFSGPSVV